MTHGPHTDDPGEPAGTRPPVAEPERERVFLRQNLARGERAAESLLRRWQAVERLTGKGSWAWRPGDATMHWSLETYRLLGRAPELEPPRQDQFVEAFRAQDQAALRLHMDGALHGEHPFSLTAVALWQDGSGHELCVEGLAVRDVHGELVEVVGTVEPAGHDSPCKTSRPHTSPRTATGLLDESEAKFRAVYESNVLPLCLWRADGALIDANDAYLRLLGYTRADLDAGAVNWHAITPLEHRLLDEQTLTLQRSGKQIATPYEKEFIRKDGTRVPVLVGGALFPDGSHGVGFALDLSDRKHVEEALRREKEFTQSIINSSTDAIFAYDREFRYTLWNTAVERLTGKIAANVIGRNAFELFPFLVRTGADRAYRNALRGEPYKDYGRHFVIPELDIDGFFDTFHVPLRNRAGEVIGGVGVLHDVTAQRRAEKTLQRREQEFEAIAENSPDIIARFDRQARYLYVNRRVESVAQRPRSLFPGKTNRELGMPEQNVQFWEEAIDETFRRGLEYRREVSLTNADGTTRTYEVCFIPERQNHGDVTTVLAIARDVTERKQTEEEARQLNLYNRSLIEASLDPLVTIGPDGRIDDVNAATEAVTGLARDRLIGTDFSEYFTEPARARAGYLEVFEKGFVRDYPLEIRHIDGHHTPVLYNASVYRDQSGAIAGVFAAARDVTERKQAELRSQRLNEELRSTLEQLKATQRQAIQAEKLSALGTLAAGIAHELNNPMMGVMNYVEYARRNVRDSQAKHVLVSAGRELERMRDLLQKMLAFVRPTDEPIRPLPLRDVLRSAVALVQPDLKAGNITVRLDVDPALPEVFAKEGPLQQVVVNLVMNARDALETSEEKRIRIRACRHGDRVEVEFADSGPGIPPEIQNQIFDPFFTTKPPGRGTGLGLSISRNIMLDIGGDLRLVNGRPGAHFVIELPLKALST